jgi:hypothetical protein
MARAAAPWAARAGAVRDRRKAERHGAARDGRGLGRVALVGFRRDGMPGCRAYSRDFQLADEACRRIRSGAASGAYAGGAAAVCRCAAPAASYPRYHQRLETDIPTIIWRIEPLILETGQLVLRVRIHPAPPSSPSLFAISARDDRNTRLRGRFLTACSSGERFERSIPPRTKEVGA